MKKNYDTETLKAIDRVISIFQDYIKDSPHFDLLWSDKVGYIFISIDPVRGTVADYDSWIVECADDLLDKLLYEMAVDIMEEEGHTLDPKEASAMERAEIERRLEPFATQFSDGPEHIQRIFARS